MWQLRGCSSYQLRQLRNLVLDTAYTLRMHHSIACTLHTQGVDVSALSAAAYVSHARRGAFCPLLADGYYHPSPAG